MKKLRESVIAKFIAWVICIASVMGGAVLGLFIVVGVSEDIFNQTRDEVLQRSYEMVNGEYSSLALRNIGNSATAQMLRDNYFKYGIIKSDSLKEINFHDKLSYLDTNMTEEELRTIDIDKLYLYQVIKRGDYGTPYVETGWGYYGDYSDISALDASVNDLVDEYTTEWRTYLYADRICYDAAKGILYYRAEENYYPVQNVSLWYDGSEGRTLYNYNYDFNRKAYKLNYKRLTEKSTEAYGSGEISEDHQQQESTADNDAAKSIVTDSVERILGAENSIGSIVNLAELNDTEFNYNNWGIILLDNIRNIDGSELSLIDSENYSEEYFINRPGYYLDENYTLVVSEDIQTDNYWVVSFVPESVPTNLVGNKYSEWGWLTNVCYDIVDMNIFQGFGICIFVMVVSFCFLAYAAGHRRGKEGIVLTRCGRIPIEVLSGCMCAVEFMMLVTGWHILRRVTEIMGSVYAYVSVRVCIGLLVLIGIVMTVTGLGYVLNLCVRIKAGKWWRNSICYRIYNRIHSLIVYIFRNMSLLWKAMITIGVVSFIEFCVLINFNTGTIVLLWLIEKVLICAGVFVLIVQMFELQKASRHMAEGNLSYKINTDKMFWECRKHGENLNKIGEGMSKAVDERMKSERFKTELITNVSHDIKTPLTSIINYVDLLGKEELNNEKAAEYLEVLDRQSSKLKKLIEDLVEASKASSGSLSVDSQRMEAGVFVTQTVGEFEEKLSLAGLQLIVSKTEEPVYIMADGRHLWRVIDNLMNNICKYAQTGSRVYVNLEATEKDVKITFRNISKYPLNISGEELMERFVRGDKSRNTEGHGLGLSIAQSLMKLIGGSMNIVVDGDLFKVVLTFGRYLPDAWEFIAKDQEKPEG